MINETLSVDTSDNDTNTSVIEYLAPNIVAPTSSSNILPSCPVCCPQTTSQTTTQPSSTTSTTPPSISSSITTKSSMSSSSSTNSDSGPKMKDNDTSNIISDNPPIVDHQVYGQYLIAKGKPKKTPTGPAATSLVTPSQQKNQQLNTTSTSSEWHTPNYTVQPTPPSPFSTPVSNRFEVLTNDIDTLSEQHSNNNSNNGTPRIQTSGTIKSVHDTRLHKLLDCLSSICPEPTGLIQARLGHINSNIDLTGHDTQHFVVDSGATHHMIYDESLLEKVYNWNPSNVKQKYVHLANGQKLEIKGYCHMDIIVDGYRIRIPDVLLVPQLTSNLFSVPQHIAFQGCATLAIENSVIITFPDFCIDTEVTKSIRFDFKITTDLTQDFDFDGFTSPMTDTIVTKPTKSFYHDSILRMVSKEASNTIFADLSDNQYDVRVTATTASSHIPQPATKGSAGYDLTSADHVTIPSHSRASVSTGLIFQLPEGIYGDLRARSGLAKKHNVTIHHGTLDPDYRGILYILVYNNSDKPFEIKPGDRIAQMVFTTYSTPTITTTSIVRETERGTKGFGSTGIRSTNSQQISAYRVVPPTSEFTSRCPRPYTYATAILQQTLPPKAQEMQDSSTPLPTYPSFVPTENPTDNPTTIADITTPTTSPSINPPTSSLTNPKQQPVPKDSPTTRITAPIRPVDRASSSSRQLVHLSSDHLYEYFGYRNIDHLLKHLPTIAQDNVNLKRSRDDVLQSTGQYSTIHKNNSNKSPLQRYEQFGTTFHMDIGYGSETAIEGVKYCLFLIDRATRQKYTYPLKNLQGSSIKTQFQQFHTDIGLTPKRIITDCDKKLLEGEMGQYMREEKIKITGAPRGRQNQNGLAERNWYMCVRMARSWLSAANLPPKFWYYAIKRAAEVSNYFPILHGTRITTPFEMAHGERPDYRTLFPIFSVGYIRDTTDVDSSNKEKFEPHTIKCITVGRDTTSDGLLFYNPNTNRVVSSSDYRLDPSKPSGISFKYDNINSLHFHLHDKDTDILRPPTFDLGNLIKITDEKSTLYNELGTIISIPLRDDQPFTIELLNSGGIIQLNESDIEQHANTPPASTSSAIADALSWIKHNAKCTLYIPSSMQKPLQGSLQLTDTNDWQFSPGRKQPSKQIPIPLPRFNNGYARQLTSSKQLMKGYHIRNHILEQQRLHNSKSIFALHVSASNLHNQLAPSSLKRHSQLHPDDKTVWDAAYHEEYYGLMDLGVFDFITEQEYNSLKHILGQKLPSMAISTIKYDENGKPQRAKYRIVALGNLDHHQWAKHETFAPVLSQLELRLLIAEATKIGRTPKTCDFKQAFCQGILPDHEKYVITPPAHCPFTPPNTYWILKRTIYGLKRSPRHWYDKACTIFKTLGLKQSLHAPCIFSGEVLPGHPPIYIGLYVDDCVYFSASDDVEKAFEQALHRVLDGKITFMGQITHFLGIKFDCIRDNNKQLTIHMSQTAFIETLVEIAGLTDANPVSSPYRSGFPIDKIKSPTSQATPSNIHLMRRLIGSLLWLSQSTRPDITTITNLLASYQTNPSPQHIEAAKRVIRYLKGTSNKGIRFQQQPNNEIASYLHFPLNSDIPVGLSDANWGPQDQSKPTKFNKNEKQPLFKN